MWTYYGVVIYIAFIVGVVNPAIQEKKRIKLLLALVPIFIYAAIRGNGIGDYFNYINRGAYISNFIEIFTKDIGMEVGYKFFAYIIKFMGLPRQTIIIVFNTISALCLSRYIKKYSQHWTMSVLLYLPIFFQFEMHAARTGVAISIVFLGMKYIEERRLFKYIFIVLLASCFHTTASIAIVLYWLYNIKIEEKLGGIIIIAALTFSLFVGIDKIVSSILSNLHLNNILAKYSAYSSSTEYGYAMEIYDPRILMGILIFGVCVVYMITENKNDSFSLNCIFLYTVLLILFREHTFIAYRISSYFYLPLIILIPKLVSENRLLICNKRSTRVILFYSMILLFTSLNLVYASQNPEYIVFWKNGQAINPW